MSITQGLHRSLQLDPGAVAVIDGDREVTFAELADRVARLAGALRARGAERGDRIGILAANRGEYIEFALAGAWGGFVISPINSRWSAAEICYQVEDAEIRFLLVDQERLALARDVQKRVACLEALIAYDHAIDDADVADYESLLAAYEPVTDVRPDPDELSVLMYTGGTTGRPKGVMLGATQVLASSYGTLASTGFDNAPGVCLHAAPMFHMSAFAGLVNNLVTGSTHVTLRVFSVESLAETIERRRVTTTSLVPTMIQWLVEHVETTGADISSLRQLHYGGAPMPRAVLERLIRLLPQVRFRQGYGMTELAPVATILRDEDHRDPEHPERLASVGRAAAHVELKVVAPDTGAELPDGEPGEIVVRGQHVMLGYWRRPEETAAALRDGWMHTGDAGYLRDGYLYLVDRIKDMIVTGGENVYSAEVERAIYQHDAVQSCAVIGLPDETWGERVHAVVVLEPGAVLDAEELRDFVGQRIARYKAPRTVQFVEALPVSSVGKILKHELRRQQGPDVEAGPTP